MSRDVLPKPPIIEPLEDNNHGTINPPNGNAINENIQLIKSPNTFKGGNLTHKDGKSCSPSISGNFKNYNNSWKYHCDKFCKLSTFSDL